MFSPLPLGLRRHGRLDEAGTYRVDPDVIAGIFECSRLGQADNTMFGCRVGDTIGKGDETEDRTRIDNRSSALGLHLEYLVLHAEPDALEVHSDHPVEGFFGPFCGLHSPRFNVLRGDACIVEGAIEAAVRASLAWSQRSWETMRSSGSSLTICSALAR